jgi:hypothetical protein
MFNLDRLYLCNMYHMLIYVLFGQTKNGLNAVTLLTCVFKMFPKKFPILCEML